MKALLTQVRREFWEHRALWIVPLVIGALLLSVAAVFGRIRLDLGDPGTHYDGPTPAPLMEMLVLGWGLPFYVAAAIQGTGYLIDCLYSERRDRSILFWRSMPVSDASTVLVKLLAGLVLVPLGAFVLAAAVSLAGSAILLLRNHDVVLNGQHVMALWSLQTWLRMQGIVFYGLVAALLWYAPFAAYLMLASVWARRSPYIWAAAPPLLLIILEHMVFGTNYVGHVLGGEFHELLHLAYRLDEHGALDTGAMVPAPRNDDGFDISFTLQLLSPERLLTSPRLWIGLLAAAAMIALSIRVRRYRDET
jgi:ABC-2 type transport system permease protein